MMCSRGFKTGISQACETCISPSLCHWWNRNRLLSAFTTWAFGRGISSVRKAIGFASSRQDTWLGRAKRLGGFADRFTHGIVGADEHLSFPSDSRTVHCLLQGNQLCGWTVGQHRCHPNRRKPLSCLEEFSDWLSAFHWYYRSDDRTADSCQRLSWRSHSTKIPYKKCIRGGVGQNFHDFTNCVRAASLLATPSFRGLVSVVGSSLFTSPRQESRGYLGVVLRDAQTGEGVELVEVDDG